MTEARYLPEHATTVDAEQRACLAALSLGRPMLSVDQPQVEQLDKDLAALVRVEIGFRKGAAEIGGRAIVRAAVTKGQEQELLLGGEASLVPCPGDSGESHRGHPGRPSRVSKGAIPLTARSPCHPTVLRGPLLAAARYCAGDVGGERGDGSRIVGAVQGREHHRNRLG